MMLRQSALFIPLLIFILLLPTSQLKGAEAAFSKDDKKVFLVTEGKLLAVDLSSGNVADLQLSKTAGGAELIAVSRTSDGRLACLTNSGLLMFDSVTGTATTVPEIPAEPPSIQGDNAATSGQGPQARLERHYFDVAVCPPANQILIISYDQTPEYARTFHYWIGSGKTQLSHLRIRRHADIAAPVFARNGEIFYAAEGDLWHGRIVHEEIPVADQAPAIYDSLDAYRYAPLGTFETANGTPSEIAVENVAVGAKMLYVQLKRWGGTGWGHIVKLMKPPQLGKREFVSPFSLPNVVAMYIRALQSLQILGDSMARPCYLCASEDGRRVFFVTRDNVQRKSTYTRVRAWLVTDDGSPHEVLLHSAEKL
jgi:hypothetical protein